MQGCGTTAHSPNLNDYGACRRLKVVVPLHNRARKACYVSSLNGRRKKCRVWYDCTIGGEGGKPLRLVVVPLHGSCFGREPVDNRTPDCEDMRPVIARLHDREGTPCLCTTVVAILGGVERLEHLNVLATSKYHPISRAHDF
jgi:hypothetical protein